MVDIARVAIIYLLGGMYLDTDMDLGPRTFSRQGAWCAGAARWRCDGVRWHGLAQAPSGCA